MRMYYHHKNLNSMALVVDSCTDYMPCLVRNQ